MGRKVGFRQLDAIKDEVIAYHKKGLIFDSVAKLVNSNRQTVANYLKEIGQYNK